jgi:predicted DNA-binding transcriptional regulator AlpA
MASKSVIKKKYNTLKGCLDEKSRRLWCATEARAIGKEGVAIVHEATGISRPTIYAGIKELESKRGRPRKRRLPKKQMDAFGKKVAGQNQLYTKCQGY